MTSGTASLYATWVWIFHLHFLLKFLLVNNRVEIILIQKVKWYLHARKETCNVAYSFEPKLHRYSNNLFAFVRYNLFCYLLLLTTNILLQARGIISQTKHAILLPLSWRVTSSSLYIVWISLAPHGQIDHNTRFSTPVWVQVVGEVHINVI